MLNRIKKGNQMNKFDRLFNAYLDWFSRTRFSKLMAGLAIHLFVLLSKFVWFFEANVLPFFTATLYWLDARFMTKAIRQAGFDAYQPAYLRAEIAKYGADGFKLLNEVSNKTIYTYVEVRHMLPLIEPDWKNKSADELALLLTPFSVRKDSNANNPD
jgi:hypothetical protein